MGGGAGAPDDGRTSGRNGGEPSKVSGGFRRFDRKNPKTTQPMMKHHARLERRAPL
jgi:hypothetical protein